MSDGGDAAPVDLTECSVEGVARELTRHLATAKIPQPRREALLILERFAGISRHTRLVDPGAKLNTATRTTIESALRRRLAREPVTRIAGETEFYGRTFRVTPDVLDPRVDSEVIVDVALEAQAGWAKGRSPRILDVGTGSGCLLGTLLAEVTGATGVGLDISQAACDVAQLNLDHLGVGARGQVICADANLAGSLDLGRFNLIVSNPPYIAVSERETLAPEVLRYDPELALFGGDDGLERYKDWLRWMPTALEPGGGLILEVGWQQAAAVSELVENAFQLSQRVRIDVIQDIVGRNRAVAAWTLW